MLIIPSWAIGTAIIIVVYAVAKIVVRRVVGPESRGGAQSPGDQEVSRLSQGVEEVQRRLGELEERMDFAERLLAKERGAERLAPPHG